MHRTFAVAVVLGVVTAQPSSSAPLQLQFETGFHATDVAGEYLGIHQSTFESEALLVEDFNGDGYTDFVVLENTDGTVSARTYYGSATGMYVAGPVSPASGGATFLDYDGDGITDILYRGSGSPGSYVVRGLRGDGTGAFGPPRVLTPDLPWADNFAVGEFTGDGVPDLAVTRWHAAGQSGSDLSIYAGTVSGPFTPTQTFLGSPYETYGGRYLVVGDVNGDLRDDVVWSVGNQLRIFLRQPAGGLSPWTVESCPGQISPMRLADVDLDGDLDVVVPRTTDVAILFGSGNGTFPSQSFLHTAVEPQFLRVADVSGDGRPELVYTKVWGSTGEGGLHLWFQSIDDVSGTAVWERRMRAEINDFRASDVDGDGKSDFVVATVPGDHLVQVCTALRLAPDEPQPLTAGTLPTPKALAVGDLDRDGKLDVVTLHPATDQMSIFWGDGNGALGNRLDLPAGDGPQSVQVGLLDGDPWPDILVVNDAGDGLSVVRGLGSRNFAAPQFTPVGNFPRGLAFGDVNGDGWPDAVVGLDLSNKMAVLHGDGTGGFAAPEYLNTSGYPWAPQVADMDRDGRLDLVYLTKITNQVQVRYGQPDGSLGPEVPGPSAWDASVFRILDANGDGLLDIASSGPSTTQTTVAMGLPDREFGFYTRSTLTPVEALAAADFDGDGRDELALANTVSPSFTTLIALLRDWQPTLSTIDAPSWGSVAGLTAMESADMNGDHRPDLVVLSSTGNQVGVLLNSGTGALVGVPPSQGPRAGKAGIVFVGPTPSRGLFDVRYAAMADVEGVLEIVSINGRVVERIALPAGPAGERSVHVNPSRRLPPGVYAVTVRQGDVRDTKKTVVID